MQFKDEAGWKQGLANNTDGYGAGIFRYAEAWADLMEQRMSDGKTVAEIAKQASHDADTEGITGFMYGAAVSLLAHCWQHGEELRRWHWHNLDTQIGTTEGRRIRKTRSSAKGA